MRKDFQIVSITTEGQAPFATYAQNNYVSYGRLSAGGLSSNEESTIALGQISISARVTVSFELK